MVAAASAASCDGHIGIYRRWLATTVSLYCVRDGRRPSGDTAAGPNGCRDHISDGRARPASSNRPLRLTTHPDRFLITVTVLIAEPAARANRAAPRLGAQLHFDQYLTSI